MSDPVLYVRMPQTGSGGAGPRAALVETGESVGKDRKKTLTVDITKNSITVSHFTVLTS